MNTAYLGDGPSRRSPVKMMIAALAFAIAPMAAAPIALAQTPAPTETVAPPTEVAPAPTEAPVASETPAAAEGEAAAGEDHFSLTKIWDEGDIVAKAVMVIMAGMMLSVFYITITKLIDQFKLGGQMTKDQNFWMASSLEEGLDALGRKNALRDIAEGAIEASNNSNSGLESRISRTDRMSHQVGFELERLNGRLQGGMTWLATVGSMTPFIGLFGTVWGIVKALIKIGQSGDPSIDKVAGPVGEALVMTAVGLAVAVPAVAAYNLLGRRNKVLADRARHFAVDVEKLMTSSTKG